MGSNCIDVIDLLLERSPTLSTARMLAVDGPAGSGKTALAVEVSVLLTTCGQRVELIHMDDLYEGWTGLDESLERRVLAQVIAPLAAGGTARWQKYDWEHETFRVWHDLPLPDVLVLEGCGAGARRWAEHTTVLVWVEAPPATRIERAMVRDGEGLLEHWAAWAALEDAVFAANATRTRADLQVTP